MTAADRSARTAAADELCSGAYVAAGATPGAGVALVAVGGYGRGELAPYSDLDVALVHEDDLDIGDLGDRIWYPIWDSGVRLDHSVRTLDQLAAVTAGDLKVASGMLDVRHLAGDSSLTLRLRTASLAQWRQQARERLPRLRAMVQDRHRLLGELAHEAVPDLKEAAGGLRDATVLKSLTATWLVDVPAADLERSRSALLDVRDLLHSVAGRGTDRIAPEHWAPLADGLGLADEHAAQRHVRELGRRITHLSRLSWRRVEDVLRRPPAAHRRRPTLVRLAPGVARSQGEVVLDRGASPASDPALILRAAAEAAERDLVLAPSTAARLVAEGASLPDPWPDEARHAMVRLLAAGPGLLPVWETLDQTGALAALLPEWEQIRLLPHASAIHRFTVDRHAIETCIEASASIRAVSRPDVLVVAALLHDIGKGGRTEHGVAGEPIARRVATRMGFDEEAVASIATLVRWHLLLARIATTRDPEDPATLAAVTDHIDDPAELTLLTALTEADARATAPQAWTSWRAGLVHELARRCEAALSCQRLPPAESTEEVEIPAEAVGGGSVVHVVPVVAGSRVTVISTDRVGLLADVAATFALARIPIRTARAWGQGEYAVSVWDIGDEHVAPGALRDRLDSITHHRIDPATRLAPPGGGGLAPTVVVHPEASDHATVIEVRTADRVGVVYHVSAALAALELTVRSAHASTLGPQAVDVFYVQEASAGALSDTRAADAAHAVRAALGDSGR